MLLIKLLKSRYDRPLHHIKVYYARGADFLTQIQYSLVVVSDWI